MHLIIKVKKTTKYSPNKLLIIIWSFNDLINLVVCTSLMFYSYFLSYFRAILFSLILKYSRLKLTNVKINNIQFVSTCPKNCAQFIWKSISSSSWYLVIIDGMSMLPSHTCLLSRSPRGFKMYWLLIVTSLSCIGELGYQSTTSS